MRAERLPAARAAPPRRPLRFDPPAPVRHLVETVGVPHTRRAVLRNGESVDLEARVEDGDRLAHLSDVRELRRRAGFCNCVRPVARAAFLADAHLGRLAA